MYIYVRENIRKSIAIIIFAFPFAFPDPPRSNITFVTGKLFYQLQLFPHFAPSIPMIKFFIILSVTVSRDYNERRNGGNSWDSIDYNRTIITPIPIHEIRTSCSTVTVVNIPRPSSASRTYIGSSYLPSSSLRLTK